MLIENKYVVHETRDDAYFTGMNGENRPVLEKLNSRVRTYDSKRAANCAIKRIEESGIEYCEFVPEYIKCENVPDVPKDEPDKDLEMREVTNPSGWEDVFACAKPIPTSAQLLGQTVTFLNIRLCRKTIGNREIFGVYAADGKLYSAGLDGGETALKRFLEEYYNYLLPRVSRQTESRKWERETVICPICGNTLLENKNWRGCSKYKTSVCEKHCKDCEYYTDYGGTSIVDCTFGRNTANRK